VNRRGGQRAGAWTLFALALILLLGATLRGLYLHEYAQAPDFDVPLVDAAFHHYWARGLATGDWTPPPGEPDPHIQRVPFFRPPGYAYTLAALFKLTGTGFLWPRVLQMAVGLLSAALAYRIARRCFGTAAGLWAALLMATHWVFILAEADFQEPVFSVLFILLLIQAMLIWAERKSLKLAVGAGILVGLLALMRPNALSLLPAIAIWMVWIQRRRKTAGWSRALIGFALGAALTIAPVTLRNWVVAHDLVWISSNGGLNLLAANRDGADGTVKVSLPGIGKLDTCFDHPGIIANLQRRLGRRLTDSQASSMLAAEAGRWIVRNPGTALELAGRRTLLFWGPTEVDDNKPVQPERENSAILRRIPTSFGLIFALSLLGVGFVAWEARRPRAGGHAGHAIPPREHELIVLSVLLVAFWFAAYLPFSILSRYRTPIVPVLILLGSLFLQHLGRLAIARDYRRLALWAALLLVTAVATHANVSGYHPSYARWHYQRGLVQRQRSHPELSIAEFQSALEHNPRYAAAANDLGVTLAQQGRIAEGIRALQIAVQLEPQDPSIRFNLAAALELQGSLAESREQYAALLRIDPDDREAQAGLQRVTAALQTEPGGSGGGGQP
jgi:4-amino-4-deoxy-L-arabinose transferase-like glycosyltransferase